MSAADNPAPNVPSDQGFYQSLWDDPDRSNRSLKRTALPAPASKNKVATPPTKRARAVLPQSAVPQSPPESKEEATRMLQYAWNVVFPSLRFPSEMIVSNIPPPPPPKIGVQDIQLGNGVVIHDVPTKYKFVVDSDLARFRRERGLVTALKEVLDQKTNRPSQHTKHLLSAFAASHPQISVIYQELLIPLARYAFLLEIKACIDNNGKSKIMDVSFMNLQNVANCSPCCTSLTNWVTELA
jgi:hypothetical protein